MNTNIFKRKTLILFALCGLTLGLVSPNNSFGGLGTGYYFYNSGGTTWSAPDNGSSSITFTVAREAVNGPNNTWNLSAAASTYILVSSTGTNPIYGGDVPSSWYTGTGYTVNFPAGVSTVQVTLPIEQTTTPDYDRTGLMTLWEESGDTAPGSGPTDIQFTVLDDNNPVGVASDANGSLYSVNYMYEGGTGGLNTNDIRFFRDYAFSPRTVNYSLSRSTAIAGTDYSPALGTVTFANGSYYADVAISANNAAQNTNKWLDVQVQGANDYLLWPGETNLSVEILQDFPAIGLASSASQVQQGQVWDLEFYNTNAYSYTPNETVNYTISGTASNGVDYVPKLSGSIVIPAGTFDVITNITTRYYTNFVGNKTVTVTVSSSGDYSVIPSASSASLQILQEFPAIGLASTASELPQGQQWELEFYNTNAWSITPAETVNYAISGTASNGVDYTPYLSGSIMIPAGAYDVITNINTTLHTNLTGTKAVTVTVSPYSTYSIITNSASATLGITPDASIVSVQATFLDAFQGGENGTFLISRSGGLGHTQAVNFVLSGTAVNGVNYRTMPTSVTFSVNQTSTNLNVVASGSPVLSGPETVVLTLATNSTYFAGVQTQAVVTLLPNNDTTNAVANPLGRYWRGTGSNPEYWSQVIPQDGETGTIYSNLYGNAASLYGIGAWSGETYYHYDATNELSQTNAANRIPYNNPIVAFGERVGGTPLYVNESYSFGVYAGDPTVLDAPIVIWVYNRTNLSNAGFIELFPPQPYDTTSWNNYTSNGFEVVSGTNYLSDGVTGTTNNFGLETILSSSPSMNWGTSDGQAQTPGAYVLTHIANDQATNYYYMVGTYGWLDSVGMPMAEDANQDYAQSFLYTLEFEQRPAWRATFLDQPQFDASPLPPFYNGMTLAAMLTNTPPVTITVAILPQNATNLNDSPELLRSPILDNFVASMNNDPIALANYVINQIGLCDPMDYSDSGNVSEQAINPTGVTRGALGTFMEKEGSPIDQCALLVYLLRQAGVPAVYEFPPRGGLKILDERLSEMLRIQIHGAYDEAGQQYTTNTMITVNYPWVAAYIGTNWVHIFPWLKDYEVTEGLNLWDEMPANYSSAYPFVHDYIFGNSNLMAFATNGDDTLRAIFPAYLQQALLQNHPGVSVDDIGTQIVNRQHYYSAWNQFPTPTWVTNANVTSLENLTSSAITNISPSLTNIFDTLSVEIYSLTDPTKDIQTGQMPLVALHNREFYIYQTATNGDKVNLSLILAPFNTNITTQAAFTNDDVYLTNKEVLSMTLDQYDDQLGVRFRYYRHRALSAAYAIDPFQTFLGLAAVSQRVLERPLRKGDDAAICLDYGQVTPEMLNVHAAELWNMQNELSANPALTNSISPDLYIGEPMYLAGMTYYEKDGEFQQLDQNLNKVQVFSTMAMGLSKLSPARDSSGNLTNNMVYPVLPNVDMFYFQTAYTGNGMVQMNSGQDEEEANQNFELLDIVNGSSEEHHAIDSFYGQTNAVSTVKLLQIAQNSGAGIVELNINNFNSEATNVYQGEELSQWDTQLWSQLVNSFSLGSTYGYVTAYVTPGPMGNSSYTGMGAFVFGWEEWQALISPESLNGAYGTPFQLDAVSSGNTANYNLNNNNNDTYTFSTAPPASGTTVAPTISPDYSYQQTYNNIMNGEYTLSDFNAAYGSSANSMFGQSTSGDTSFQAYAAAYASTEQSGNMSVGSILSQALTDVGDPVEPITGEFYIDTTDLRVPGPLPLSLRRNYSSQNLADNQFGTGWKLSIMPYLAVGMEGTNLYAADMDGAVLAYVETATNANVWTPTLVANPQLDNNTTAGSGGMVNRLRDRIVQTASGSITNYTLYACDGSVRRFQVMSFDSDGLDRTRPYLLNWTDSRGNYYNFSYGTNSSQPNFGQMVKIQCSNGNYLDFDYDVYGHIVDAYTGDGRWAYYTYDQYNDLTSVTLPDNSARSYEYLHAMQSVTNDDVVTQEPYSTHLIVEEDKPDGRELINEYDDQRRVTNQLSTAGSDLNPIPTATFTYANDFNITNSFTNTISGYTLITDGNGNTSRYDYTNNLVTKVTYPLGVNIQQTWYPDETASPGYPRSLATSTDKRGMVTQYEYDSSGNVTNMVTIGDITGDGIASQTATNTAVYDPANNLPLEILDAAGNGMEYVYDPTFTYMPQQTIRLAGGVPVSTNFMYYADATNVVQNGNIMQTNMALGLLSREVRAYSSDASTNDTLYDGQGFPIETIQYTGTGDPNITNAFFYNERGMMVDEVDALGAVTYRDYDAMNRPTETENFDEFGNPLSLILKYYNENGELNWTEGPQYNPDDYVYYDYDGAGRLTMKIQWLSQANSDGSGVSAASGNNLYAQSFSVYDPLGNLTLAVDPRGAETTNTYDALCRLVQSTHLDTDGATILSADGYSYEPGGQVQNHTNALGGVSTMYYTITGKPEYEINADGSTNGWRYYLDGRVKREIQSNGAYWQTTYDDLNRVTTRVFYSAAGIPEATNMVYFDRRGNQIEKVDAGFNEFTSTYDGLNRVKSTVGPAIVTVTAEQSGFIPDGSVTYVTNVLQQTLTNFYDAAGRVVTCVNDLGEKTVTTSDAIGRVTSTRVYNSLGALIHENYTSYSLDHNSITTTNGSGPNAIVNTTYVDTEGHDLLSLSYPVAGSIDYTWKTYDLAGNLTYQEQDSLTGNSGSFWKGAIFDYDGLNRCVEKIDRNSAVTTYAYDQLSDLTNRTMPGTLQWQAAYNDAGHMLRDQISGGGQTTRSNSYTYYSAGSPFAGMLDTKTDGRGLLSTYSYDDWLRPVSIDRVDPTYRELDTFYGYDARGYATNITEKNTGYITGANPRVILRTYDPYGQLSSESISINGVGFSSANQTWDSVGRRTGLNINGANYMYGWNSDGMLTYASSPNGSGFYSYDTAGLLTNRVVGSRTTSTTSRDGEGRPLSIVTSIYGDHKLTESMTWNGDGTLASHVLERPDFTDSRLYQYSALSRRLSYEQQNINGSTTWTNDFLYDSGADTMGVLTEMGQPGSALWNGGVSPFERVNAETNTCIGYPAYGRLNGQATLTVTLDGLPLSVTTNNSSDPSYPFEWRTLMELTPGAHQLKVAALHPSGAFTAWATNSFTNNFANQTESIFRDGNGNITERLWRNSDGTTNRSQFLHYDAKNRLVELSQVDSQGNGFLWLATYDALDRRLLTQCYPTANWTTPIAGVTPTTINQYYDPMVEFQELGVSYGNNTEWKLYGPDLDGQYGGENGTGGFDAVSPGLNLFYPTISDFRGNVLGEITNGAIAWNSARPTGYGAVPGYRPVALAHGADVVQSSAWRGRWVDITGYYSIGERLYDPVTGMWLSYDPTWNESDPNYLTFCGGDPIMGFDADGRLAQNFYNGAVGPAGQAIDNFAFGQGATAFNWAMQNAEGINNMMNGPDVGYLNNAALNDISTEGNQAVSSFGNEIGANPNSGAAQLGGALTEFGLDAGGLLMGGEAGEAGELDDVGAEVTEVESVGSEPAERAAVEADQSEQVITQPAEAPSPGEEVPSGNVAAEESAQAPLAESASVSSASTDFGGASSVITDPAQMLQAPAEAADTTPVFWSGGRAAEDAARTFANANNGIVIGDTSAGRDLAQSTANVPWSQARPQWLSLSEDFARSASGEVNVFQNARGVAVDSIWRNEYEILMQNPNVTKINFNVVMPNGSVVPVP